MYCEVVWPVRVRIYAEIEDFKLKQHSTYAQLCTRAHQPSSQRVYLIV